MAVNWTPRGAVERDPLLEHRAFWADNAGDPAGRVLRLVARAVLEVAQQERRERERHLLAVGRTTLLPAEDRLFRERGRTLLQVLDLLRDVYDDLPDDEA